MPQSSQMLVRRDCDGQSRVCAPHMISGMIGPAMPRYYPRVEMPPDEHPFHRKHYRPGSMQRGSCRHKGRESSLPGRQHDWLLVRIPAIVMTPNCAVGMTELGVPYVARIQPQSLVCRRASGPGGPRLGHYL